MPLKELLLKFSRAVEANDGHGLAKCFTPDGVYDDYFFGPSAAGPEGIVAMLAHFYEGGRDFKWDFLDPVAEGSIGYAGYHFSYGSLLPEAHGARVVFEGIARLELEDGLIRRYSEVFDRGMALAQLDFAPERMKKIALKYADRLKARPEVKPHTFGKA